METKRCEICGTKYKANKKWSKFCSLKCKYKHNYQKNKDIINDWRKNHPEKIIEYNKRAHEYFLKDNPERFNELMRNNYHKNKKKWHEVNYVNRNRDKLLKLIGNKCKKCSKKVDELHHISYLDLPKKSLEKYSQYLIPLCRKCHRRIHSEK